MKKLCLLFLILLAFSCTPTYEGSEVKDGLAVTTVQIQQNVIDSCAVLCTDGKYVYVMEDDLVKYRLIPATADTVSIGYLPLVGLAIGNVLFFLILLVILLKDN